MSSFSIIGYYIRWHYSRAFRDIALIARDYFIFLWHFFSIYTLFSTLFSPWRRLGESYHERMSIEDRASTFVLNTIMRCVGAGVRMMVIMVGLSTLVGFVIAVVTLFVAWILFPVILFYLLWFIIELIYTL
jgi:hypothetical protein